jgi:hypothetical protein
MADEVAAAATRLVVSIWAADMVCPAAEGSPNLCDEL